jgi:hypothetical protein
LDIEVCGKRTIEVAGGIDRSLKRLQWLITARYFSIAGDAEGGGAVQHITKELVTKDTALS